MLGSCLLVASKYIPLVVSTIFTLPPSLLLHQHKQDINVETLDPAASRICSSLQIGQNMKKGMIMKDKFKIVYVAPMKALAAEMTSTFSKRLAPLGQDGALLTS